MVKKKKEHRTTVEGMRVCERLHILYAGVAMNRLEEGGGMGMLAGFNVTSWRSYCYLSGWGGPNEVKSMQAISDLTIGVIGGGLF